MKRSFIYLNVLPERPPNGERGQYQRRAEPYEVDNVEGVQYEA